MNLLQIKNLTKVYGNHLNKVTAINDMNLEVEKGEFIAIVGESGSGKSTLMHMIGGVDNPTSGKVFVEDTDITTLTETKLAIFRRRKVGLIYQFYNLIPTFNVRKNILLPMLLDNREVDEDIYNGIIKILGLENHQNHLPSELSGGQQQRVSIGRSLIYRPAIILADEPTGNLDRKNSEEIISLLKLSNKKYHQTILMITHNQKLALEADRIITIEDGRIIADKVV